MDMQERITQKLKQVLTPTKLEVINESHLHAGHAGDDGSGASHFSIKIESKTFKGVSRVARERMVHSALSEEIQLIHALSISTHASE